MLRNHRRATIDTTPRGRVVSLLEAAAAPTEPGPLPGEAEALAAFRASQSATRRPTMLSSLASVKVTVAAALSGLVLTGGVGAAAAAGSLPGAAQDTASELLGKVGVTVPGADGHSAGHADERGVSEDAAERTDEPTSQGKGDAVSGMATDPDLEGKEKGATISEYASNGKSKAGDEHGAASSKADDAKQKAGEKSDEGADATTKAPVETPDTGSTDTADDATTEKAHGAAASGTDKADETGEGHSTAGSEDRP